MAGALTISTLNDSSGVLATQNGMKGIAKAWVRFNGVTTTSINDSFNVSSVTRNGTGDYTVNFTTSMPNANYATVGMASYVGTANEWMTYYSAAPTTTAVRVASLYNTSTLYDAQYASVIVFSA